MSLPVLDNIDEVVESIIEEQTPQIQNEYLNEDGTINWAAHANNAMVLIANAEAKVQKEIDRKLELQEMATPPRTDTGRTVDNIFRRLGDLTYNPDKITPRTYERMMLDAKISMSLKGLARITVGRGWEIVKGKKEHREFLQKMLDNINMNEVFYQMILRTLQFGHTSTEKVYDINDAGEWYIKRYKVLPSKDMRYKQTVTGIIKKYVQEVSIDAGSTTNTPPVIHSRPSTSPFRTIGERTFPPIKINHAVHDPMFGNPYGTSALKSIYKAWLLKDHMLRYWSRYCEIMGGGFMVGKSGNEKPKTFRVKLDAAKASSTIGIRDDQEIQLFWPPGGESPFEAKVNYYNARIAEGLGFPDSLLNDSGTKDLSETHTAMLKLIWINPLQQMSQRWIEKDFKLLIDLNFGVEDEYPEVMFKAWSSLELEQRANFFRKLAMMQAIGTEDIWWIRRDLELPAIDDFEDIGDPLVKIQNQPGQGSGDSGGGDTTDSTDSTKREGVGTVA